MKKDKYLFECPIYVEIVKPFSNGMLNIVLSSDTILNEVMLA